MRFEWDEGKALSNVSKHRVTFNEAASVLGDALAWTYPDKDHSEDEERWITVGLSESGRILVVSHTSGRGGATRIISARNATRNERRFYEEG